MPTLDELRGKKAELELQREITVLEADVHAGELINSVVMQEGWGDQVAIDAWAYDGVGLSNFGTLQDSIQISRPQDRKRGDNAPTWRTEAQHARIRGIARVISTIDEVGISALENLTNYCIGQGLTYKVTPAERAQKTEAVARLAAQAQDVIDRFIEKNSWWGDGEREVFTRSRRDGEQHLGLYRDGAIPRVRLIDPSFVTEPTEPRALEDHLRLTRGNDETLDWKYGHASPWNDSSRTEQLFVLWYGDPLEWEVLPESRFVHIKLNVDREIKRGLSDYHPVSQTLQNADKLFSSMVQGEAVRQAIAYIREHAEGVTAAQIGDFAAARADEQKIEATRSGGTRTRYGRQIKPGTVPDIRKGSKYHDGPASGQRGRTAVAILQAALRRAGVRWQQPESMISGDASNANFSSSLVAEAPFTKSAEAKQTHSCRKSTELLWKVLAMAHHEGSFDAPPRHAQRLLSLTVTGPEIAVRDRKEDHLIRKEEFEAGIRSPDSWAEAVGLKLADEKQKGAAPVPLSQRSTRADHGI